MLDHLSCYSQFEQIALFSIFDESLLNFNTINLVRIASSFLRHNILQTKVTVELVLSLFLTNFFWPKASFSLRARRVQVEEKKACRGQGEPFLGEIGRFLLEKIRKSDNIGTKFTIYMFVVAPKHT